MNEKKQFKKFNLSPFLIMLIVFLLIIFIGTLLLFLPISHKKGEDVSFINAFFLSTSCVCVTGLTPIPDIGSTFSIFGKVVMCFLIEIGGLGFVTIVISFLSLFGFKIGIFQRNLIKEALNQNTFSGLVLLVRKIMITAFVIQLIGVILNLFVFIPDYGAFKGIGYSIFHAISGFNNAGFDILGSTSLIKYSNNILLNISTSLMIILGGIGFIVIFDIIEKRSFKKLSLHSKIVLKTTLFLLIFGTLLFKLTNFKEITWLESFFLSVTTRTAGFSTIDLNVLNTAGLLILMVFMFIGASPSSTGGGIKTTTAYTIFKSLKSFCFGNKNTVSHNRKISESQVSRAFILTIFAIVFVVLMSFIILVIEGSKFTLEQVFTETFSAFATVGLSLSVTPKLTVISKIIICIMMFVGRLGPITFMSLLNKKSFEDQVDDVEYVEEKIIIG